MIVGILGLGLIGGSLARAYAKAGHTVLACEKDETILSYAQLADICHKPLTDENLPTCDLILLSVYSGASAQWLEQHGAAISQNALVIDCCGIKTEVCKRCFPVAKK